MSKAQGVAKDRRDARFWSARERVLVASRQRGQVMAEQEMKAANETYAGFLSMLKIGTIITVVVAAFVVLIIS